jgi:hypothetical protein
MPPRSGRPGGWRLVAGPGLPLRRAPAGLPSPELGRPRRIRIGQQRPALRPGLEPLSPGGLWRHIGHGSPQKRLAALRSIVAAGTEDRAACAPGRPGAMTIRPVTLWPGQERRTA